MPRTGKCVETESRLVAKGWGEDEVGSNLLAGTDFILGVICSGII